MSIQLRTKLIGAFLLTVLTPLIGTGLYGNWITSRALEDQAIDAAKADLLLRGEQIENYLAGVREDVLFLAHTDEIKVLLSAPDTVESAQLEANRESLATAFAAFLLTHPDLLQIRYLDESGEEIVRVDAASVGGVIAQPTVLQNKADRYYFNATMDLDEWQVYISSVDLNQEFGEIQVPLVPTIRYATPVFYDDAKPAGIVILNLDAKPFLSFANLRDESGATLFLADESGWYLAHPDNIRIFGGPADLQTGHGLAADYPDIWPEGFSSAEGVIAPTTTTIIGALEELLLPIGLGRSRANASRVLVYQRVSPEGTSGPEWLIVRDEPRINLFAAIWEFRLGAILILALAAGGASLIAVVLTQYLTQPVRDLTEAVSRLGRGVAGPPIPVRSADEFGDLASAFNEMEEALHRNLEQLSLLNRAGQHITARLDRPEVLAAAGRAVDRLFPARWICLNLSDEVAFTSGDIMWEVHRQTPEAQSVLQSARTEAEWRSTALLSDGALAGYLACAPLCVGGEIGLIELYGEEPALADDTTGNLLSALATQISIALDNAALYEQLIAHRAELQALVERLISAQEEERRVVAYDIHDGLIQMMVGARLHLSNSVADQGRRPEEAQESRRKGLDELAAAIVEARRVIEGLRPAALDDLGLVATLRQYAEHVAADWGVVLDYDVELRTLRAPQPVELCAYRIAQEAITNARKYSNTETLHVALHLNNGMLQVIVRDEGDGFSPTQIRDDRGVGLTSMRERARLLGGRCQIESSPGEGTTVIATLPTRIGEAVLE